MQIKKKTLISASMVWWSQGKDEKNKDELQIFLNSFGLRLPKTIVSSLLSLQVFKSLRVIFWTRCQHFQLTWGNFFLSMKTFYLKGMKTKVRLLHVHVSVFQAVKVPGWPVGQVYLQQRAELQILPAQQPVAAANLTGNNFCHTSLVLNTNSGFICCRKMGYRCLRVSCWHHRSN